jgi:hypothetical protein
MFMMMNDETSEVKQIYLMKEKSKQKHVQEGKKRIMTVIVGKNVN